MIYLCSALKYLLGYKLVFLSAVSIKSSYIIIKRYLIILFFIKSLVNIIPPCSALLWIDFGHLRWRTWCLRISAERSVWLTSVSTSRIICDCSRSLRRSGKTCTNTACPYYHGHHGVLSAFVQYSMKCNIN